MGRLRSPFFINKKRNDKYQMKKIKISDLKRALGRSDGASLGDQAKLIILEEKLLDAIEPVLAKEKDSFSRMSIAGTVLKVALILYQADLGTEATAGLMYEVGDQVDKGLLDEVDTNNPEGQTLH